MQGVIDSSPSIHKRTRLKVNPYVVFLGIVGVLAVAGAGFYGGMIYQKHHLRVGANTVVTATNQAGDSRFGGGFGGGLRAGRVFGQVTAVSSTSISVQDTRTGTTTTLSITSATQIMNNSATVAASSIQVGDTVLVSPASAGSTQAGRITVNPDLGGGFSGTNTSPDVSTN